MFEKLEKTKVFRDPLYGNIPVEYKIIWDLIDTKEVQRLRRIRQLSGVAMVFHTAEHSRFTHAIGAYHIADRVIKESKDLSLATTEYEKLLLLISALLHDIGHGPFSHAFEKVFNISHEDITCQMILSPDTEINKVLVKYSKNLPDDVAGIIGHVGKYPVVESLISSQLDVDRMDYLNRDASYTGAQYGFVDVDRIIRIIRVKDNKVCYSYKGIHAIENYLMSRYHMYWQIYYHPMAKSYEIILESVYQRINDLLDEGKEIDANIDSLKEFKLNKSLEDYIDLDDAYINGMVKQLTKSKDTVLNDLCNAFMNRRLFSYIYLPDGFDNKESIELRQKYISNQILKRYYFKEVKVSQSAYLHQENNTSINNIQILSENGELISVDEYSPIIKGLLESGKKEEIKLFYGKVGE